MKNRIVKSGVTGFRVFLILSFIAFMLLFGAGIVAFLIALLENRMELNVFLFMSGFCLAVVGLSLWGVILQIKKIKKDKRTEIVEYTEELNICFESQISYKDYRNFMLWSITTLYLILFPCLCFFVYKFSQNDVVYTIIFTSIILFCILFLHIRQAKNRYQTNKMFHETITYTLKGTPNN